MPYQEPFQAADTSSVMDLRPHLTNTCLQEGQDEGNVRLLQELIGSSVLSSPHEKAAITQEDVSNIMKQMEDILRETFTAALQMPVHFQVSVSACFIVMQFLSASKFPAFAECF